MTRNRIGTALAALSLMAGAASGETYTLVGQRYLRLYTAPEATQSYNAEVDVQKIAATLCEVPWTKAVAEQAESTAHQNDALDGNVAARDRFDAALFCAGHTNGMHRAYANAAVYRYRLPDGELPALTRLSVRVTSDPYNANGARIAVLTKDDETIPTDCATCRGETAGGLHLASVAPRITRQSDGKDFWYPNTTNVVVSANVPLGKYLFVFVLMENYATARGNWIEGCSYIENAVTLTTSAPVPGWTDGSVVNLMEIDTGYGDTSLEDLMAYFETTQTVVTAKNAASGEIAQFAAPRSAYRRIATGSTNLVSVTHRVAPYGEIFVRGERVTLTNGWRALAVQSRQRIAVTHADVRAERGFEANPPVKPFTSFDRAMAGLGAGCADMDGDGVADGWELYVGADPTDPTDGISDWDRDGLTLAEEFDHGFLPTNPSNAMTAETGMLDSHVYHYHLKGRGGGLDADNDGLSNYAEYLASEILHVAVLDPDNARSDGITPDFDTPYGDTCVGFVLSPNFFFEPYLRGLTGADNGWSDYANARAAAQGMTNGPQPELRIKVRYYGAYREERQGVPIVVEFLEDHNSFGWMEGLPSGWITNVEGRVFTCAYRLDNVWASIRDNCVGEEVVSKPVDGRLREGSVNVRAFADLNGDGKFTAGEPFGVLRNVSIGWSSPAFEIEIADNSPIFDRIAVTPGDRASVSSRYVFYGSESGAALVTEIDTNAERYAENPFNGGRIEHVRIVPFAVRGTKQSLSDNDGLFKDITTNRVVAAFDVNVSSHPYISEYDFLDQDRFDVDWDGFAREVLLNNEIRNFTGASAVNGLGIADVTAVKYMIVLGDQGPINVVNNMDTTTVIRAFQTLVERRFEANGKRTKPVAKNPGTTERGIIYGEAPTFTWTLPEPKEVSGRFGCSYTAFKLQVLEAETEKVVYSSGIKRAPAKNANGEFMFTAPLWVGAQCVGSDGTVNVIQNGQLYAWRVVMYNAKFREAYNDDAEKYWSQENPQFSFATQKQQEMNDHTYSSIAVAVKYMGPKVVLNGGDDITSLKAKVRVQAFDTPDFTGKALSEAVVTNVASITDTGSVTANAVLVGLPNVGKYYVRAFIDSDGDFQRSAWESWGYVNYVGDREREDIYTPKAVELDGDMAETEVEEIWVEDCDTNGDLMPDAWTYAKYGALTNVAVAVTNPGALALPAAAVPTVLGGTANVANTTPGATLTVLMDANESYRALSITNVTSVALDAIRATVLTNILDRIGQ